MPAPKENMPFWRSARATDAVDATRTATKITIELRFILVGEAATVPSFAGRESAHMRARRDRRFTLGGLDLGVLVDGDAVLAVALGLVQRRVGARDQLLAGEAHAARRAAAGHAEARRHAQP